MTKFANKSFSVGGYSKALEANWEATFQAERPPRHCKYCGRDCRGDYCSRSCREADDDE